MFPFDFGKFHHGSGSFFQFHRFFPGTFDFFIFLF
jgi:hypothetical protein